MTTTRDTRCFDFRRPSASGILSLTRCGSSSAQSAMLLGVKAGLAAPVSYHSLTGGSYIYQNLIVPYAETVLAFAPVRTPGGSRS